MTDNNLTRPVPADNINSEHFRRIKAGQLRAADSGELRDVNAEELQIMYQTEKSVTTQESEFRSHNKKTGCAKIKD